MIFLCTADTIPEAEGRAFQVVQGDDRLLQVLLIRFHGQYYAYENACAHFGVRLDTTADYRFLDQGKVVCQVHYARYDPVTGACVGGECDKQGLRSLPIEITDTGIYLSV